MKQIFYVLLVSAAVLTTSCNKNGGYPKGEGSVSWNGEQRKAEKIFGTNNQYNPDNMNLDFYFPPYNNYPNEFLLRSVGKHYGRQTVKPRNSDTLTITYASYYSRQEEDVTGDAYTVLKSDSANNWVEITEAKSNFTKDIKGRFSVTMVRTKKFLNSPFPDTVRFTNGSFSISKLAEID